MDLQISGHVAIVQGASKGLGLGIARALAAEGCNLLLTARTEAPLREAATALAKEHGVRVATHALDSAHTSAMAGLVESVRAEFGRLDIVVCNSGGPPAGGIKDLTEDQWRAAAELLLVAPVALVRAALPLLALSPAPRFFVVTSSSTKQPVLGLTLSNTLRPGVVGLVRTMADELAAERVRCHSIAPGRFDTDRLDHLIEKQSEKLGKPPEAIRQAMIDSIPAGRLGDPVDLGRLVAFLSSPAADYLNGGNWLVDGGLVRLV